MSNEIIQKCVHLPPHTHFIYLICSKNWQGLRRMWFIQCELLSPCIARANSMQASVYICFENFKEYYLKTKVIYYCDTTLVWYRMTESKNVNNEYHVLHLFMFSWTIFKRVKQPILKKINYKIPSSPFMRLCLRMLLILLHWQSIVNVTNRVLLIVF